MPSLHEWEKSAWSPALDRSPISLLSRHCVRYITLLLSLCTFIYLGTLAHHSRPIAPQPDGHIVGAAERLVELNRDYNPKTEGFGTGSVDLQRYRQELVEADLRLFGGKLTGGAEGELCQLDLEGRPSASGGIPQRLFMTSHSVSPEPPALESWRTLNPGLAVSLYNDSDVSRYVATHFPNGTIGDDFRSLPLPILKYDLFRLLALLSSGGYYTDADTFALQPLSTWSSPDRFVDHTDASLVIPSRLSSASAAAHDPPSLVIGIEMFEHTTNKGNPLFSRDVSVVQWSFGSIPSHPVLLDAVRRIVKHSRMVEVARTAGPAGGAREDEPLHFDPWDNSGHSVLEWSGPLVFTDAVARYLKTRWGYSLRSMKGQVQPVRVGDVLILPLGSLNTPPNLWRKLVEWVLGQNYTALWTTVEDRVRHAHSASWWGQLLEEAKDDR